MLLRYLPNGSPDPTFGSNNDGKVIYQFPNNLPTQIQSIALQPDGKIIAVGIAGLVESSNVIIRFNSNGWVDDGGFVNGVKKVDGQSWNTGNDVVFQDDGKIVVAGEAGFTSPTFNPEMLVQCFNGYRDARRRFRRQRCGAGRFRVDESAVQGRDRQPGSNHRRGSTDDFGGKWAIARFNSDGSPAGSKKFDGLNGAIGGIAICWTIGSFSPAMLMGISRSRGSTPISRSTPPSVATEPGCG